MQSNVSLTTLGDIDKSFLPMCDHLVSPVSELCCSSEAGVASAKHGHKVSHLGNGQRRNGQRRVQCVKIPGGRNCFEGPIWVLINQPMMTSPAASPLLQITDRHAIECKCNGFHWWSSIHALTPTVESGSHPPEPTNQILTSGRMMERAPVQGPADAPSHPDRP